MPRVCTETCTGGVEGEDVDRFTVSRQSWVEFTGEGRP